MTKSQLDNWMDGQEIMLKLHVSARTLQRWRTNNSLPYTQVNKKIFYRVSDVLALLEKNYNGEDENER